MPELLIYIAAVQQISLIFLCLLDHTQPHSCQDRVLRVLNNALLCLRIPVCRNSSFFSRIAAAMSLALRLTRPATRFWRFYCDQLERRPLLTKCCTGVVGTIASDGMAQLTAAAVKKKTSSDAVPYDWGRTARLVTWSFCVGTPMGATWFKFLDDVSVQQDT